MSEATGVSEATGASKGLTATIIVKNNVQDPGSLEICLKEVSSLVVAFVDKNILI